MSSFMTAAIFSAFPATKYRVIRSLLVRGMLIGVVAGLLAFCFARLVGEPEVNRAIAFESGIDHAEGKAAEPQLVSRRVQSRLGLFTGAVLYGVALGGIFGLVFAYAQGRYSVGGPRQLSAVIASLGYAAVVVVPTLKYPANPPAVGNPDTLGIRTAAYFLLIAFSLAILGVAVQFYRRFAARFGSWNGILLAAMLYVVLIAMAYSLFPNIDEVPSNFPATLLWRFRVASAELQAVLWATLGVAYGWFTERDRTAA